MAELPMKVVKLDDTSVLVAKLKEHLVPGADYAVEISITKADGGPTAAGCTVMASCGTFKIFPL